MTGQVLQQRMAQLLTMDGYVQPGLGYGDIGGLRCYVAPPPVERGTVDEREAFEVTADRIQKSYPDGAFGCVVLPTAVAEVILAFALAGRGASAT